MKIDEYLIHQCRKVIRSYYRGFDPNPLRVPMANVVSVLSDLRRSDFLTFRKELQQDGVLLIKALLTMDSPGKHEALFLGDLRGNSQLIDLKEVEEMTDEEKRDDNGPLHYIHTLLTNQKYLRIVEHAPELVKLGEQFGIELDPEKFTPLMLWHPGMPRDIWGALKLEFPERWEPLTLAFNGSEKPGWRWELQPTPEILGLEQARLIFAISAALINLTLDGFVLHLFGTEWKRQEQERLGICVDEAMAEETMDTMERLGKLEIRSQMSETADREQGRRNVKYKRVQGVTLSESLPFGWIKVVDVNTINDCPGKILRPQRQYIRDLVEWEEALESIQVVPALPVGHAETAGTFKGVFEGL